MGRKIDLETKVGIVPVEISSDGLITMEQKQPEFLGLDFDKKEIAGLLGISENDFLEYPIELVSTSVPKLMIPVKDLKTLFSIKPDFDGIKSFCERSKVRGFYPFTLETQEADSDFHARQFNPLAGIPEDPVTGVAAGALGAYAVKHNILNKNKFVVEQGYIMQKSGKIFVEISDKVRVGGYAVEFGK